jgi:ribosomal protein S8E
MVNGHGKIKRRQNRVELDDENSITTIGKIKSVCGAGGTESVRARQSLLRRSTSSCPTLGPKQAKGQSEKREYTFAHGWISS